MHDFDFIAIFKQMFAMPTFRHDAAIDFDGNTALGKALLIQ